MNTTAARSQKRNDCFWRDKPVNQVVTDDRVWVGSRRCSVRVANGGFAALLEISCHSGNDPEADIAPQGVSPANFYQSLQQMPCWIGGHGTVP